MYPAFSSNGSLQPLKLMVVFDSIWGCKRRS
jgi:hypothetical protein